MSERTPQQIIGDDAFNQLVFEGYVVTRPAPAATDTGLVTGLWLRPIGPHAYATTKDRSTADDWEKFVKVEEYIPRSQAEELLAAKDERLKEWQNKWAQTDILRLKAEADNAAKDARIKVQDQEISDQSDRIASLEAKISAARKALEWYEEHVSNCRKIGSVGAPSRAKLDRDGGQKAREALEQ